LGKIEKGEDVNSMMALYQEWMNLSDKTFVSLFESDEYSQIMAEVSSMQMRLKKDMEAQAEKFLVGVPVATRSEMDELYKTIYDLKKQVRELEKLAVGNISANPSTEEAAPKAKSAKK
jgi:polyhydroxyalkanoate synthesis regulator phasin